MIKKTRKKKDVTRECYVGAKMTKAEKKEFYSKHEIKGRNASKIIRALLLNGVIE